MIKRPQNKKILPFHFRYATLKRSAFDKMVISIQIMTDHEGNKKFIWLEGFRKAWKS